MITYELDQNNIAILTLDNKDKDVNVINREFIEEIGSTIDKLESEDSLRGVIFMSAKDTFIAGADVELLFSMQTAEEIFAFVEEGKANMRRVENLDVPVVAALNGTALGGGLEFALCSHCRIAIDNDKIKFGLPEVTLGLMPGGDGITRLTRLIGLQEAFPFLMEGKQVTPKKALDVGIVNQLVQNRDELKTKAIEWVKNNPDVKQPWDSKGFRMPGGDPRHPQIAQMLAVAPAMLTKKTKGNYPAPEAIMSAAAEGALVDFDTASRIESRYFAKITSSSQAKNMINAFWFQLNEINSGNSRPKEVQKQETNNVGVLGAGLMGHGVAYVSAYAGMNVSLKEVSEEKAKAGKDRIDQLLSKRVKIGKMTDEKKDTILSKIQPTDNTEDLNVCDLIIEAVFENREIKKEALEETEKVISENTIFGSNTSTLPITSLAANSIRPSNFIGIHFFSPVHKMKLVEIIVGEKTSDQALAKAFDFVLKIRKIPIVVRDSRGFYTSRVFGTYVLEGMNLIAEGISPVLVESAGLLAGMAMGPLSAADEVNLGLAQQIRDQEIIDFEKQGMKPITQPGHGVLEKMVKELKRTGKAQGQGFYEYPDSKPKNIWTDITNHFPPTDYNPSFEEIKERIMFVQSLESSRCFHEGVLSSAADANIGSIFGWGFAPFKGGTLQFINDYGLSKFVTRCNHLSEQFGERFSPPAELVKMAEENKTY